MVVEKKTTGARTRKPAKPKPRPEATARDRKAADETAADLARGANGVSDYTDAQEAVQGMVEAQMKVMNAMMSASVEATQASLKAMANFWTAALPKGRKDD